MQICMTEAQSGGKGTREKGENLRWWSLELKIKESEHWISPRDFLNFQTNMKSSTCQYAKCDAKCQRMGE